MANRSLLLSGLILIFLGNFSFSFGEKIYVVERERSNLAVIENGKFKKEIKNLGKLHHATVKFKGEFAYVISRDGWLSQIDFKKDIVVKKVKVGKSSIGLNFWKSWIIVANYDPGTVVFLNEKLEIKKTIQSKSRNVGLKIYHNYICFALMDLDSIWVIDGNKNFQIVKKIEKVGRMPFDAMMGGHFYIVGCFKDKSLGVLDCLTLKFRKIFLTGKDGGVIFKIPHFGLWGIASDLIYIPSPKTKKIYILKLSSLKLTGFIPLQGNPVFVVVSPDKKILAVNYSGSYENFFSLIDLKSRKTKVHLKAGKRILHFRFSGTEKKIYLSSYYEHLVKTINLPEGKISEYSVKIPTPSGIFLVPELNKKNIKRR